MNCIIVEDEFPAREELKYHLKDTDIELLGEFENGEKALEYLSKNMVDVIFLDINMNGLDGIAFGKIIHKFKRRPKIIFITAYKEYAVEAFEINAFDYLLKPYGEDRIKSCIERLFEVEKAEKSREENHCRIDRLSLWCGEKMLVKSYEEILFVEACERESKVYIANGDILIAKMPISKIENILPVEFFFRSHRSYIVNIKYIHEIVPWSSSSYILKIGKVDKEIPVSRNKIKEFKILMHMS